MTDQKLNRLVQAKRDAILQRLKELDSVLVALSGGVDSSVMAALAFRALGDQALAVTFNSPLIPPDELEDAKRVAKQIGIKHRIEAIDELSVASITENPRERCFHCKTFRFRKARALALQLGIAAIVDGTTLSDLDEYRPGLQALNELGIVSPLLEAKITKNEARQLATAFGLPVADKASNSCLATRIPYGETLTEDRLGRVAAAEEAIRQIVDVHVLRVRDHGKVARIEVSHNDILRILHPDIADKIVQQLQSLGYRHVAIDLVGYRFGSFDEDKL